MAALLALLRGINVGSTRKVPMARLRAACAAAGLGEVRTYIQSGNLVLTGTRSPEEVARKLSALVQAEFGLEVPVIVRTAAQWEALQAECPFAEAASTQPEKTMLLVSQRPAAAGAVAALRERAQAGEQIAPCAGDLAAYFPEGAGRSRLTPVLIDRLVGSPTTVRNWNTVRALGEMLG